MDITPDMIDALDALRVHARYRSIPDSLKDAIKTLDKAGVFGDIDEDRDREEEMYARLMAGLRDIDLDDRYPKGDENGIIAPASRD